MLNRPFTLYGHRGARGLAPENSLPGYAIAIKIGVDVVDMDVAMTKDKVVVVQHDLKIDPNITRDNLGSWVSDAKPVREMNFNELQQFDVGRIRPKTTYASYFPNQMPVDGTRIPSLTEAIQFVKQHSGDKIKFQIEIKNEPDHANDGYTPYEMAKAVADIIETENIVDRTEVQAFNWQCLYELQKINPRITRAYLTNLASETMMRDPDPVIAGLWSGGKLLKDYENSIPRMIKALGGDLWDPQDVELTPQIVDEAHALGLRVVAWSSPSTSGKDVDLPMTEKIISMGVDGVITDRPDEVIRLRR